MKRPPEMSRAQFNAALKRNGLKKVLLWINDTTGIAPGIGWGMILHRNGKNAYRASLARALRERNEIEKGKSQ